MIKKTHYLIVGAGGALGALARYWIGGLFKIEAGGFPLNTLLINLTGSFILGFFLTLIIERYPVATEWRLFFATGFIGAYTTFSSFTNEVLTLLREGYVLTGFTYAFLSLFLGMVCISLGLVLARLVAFGRIRHTKIEIELQSSREAD
jgi:CrcB protein